MPKQFEYTLEKVISILRISVLFTIKVETDNRTFRTQVNLGAETSVLSGNKRTIDRFIIAIGTAIGIGKLHQSTHKPHQSTNCGD